jgi:Xaa-Pro aminopeptidase
MAYQAKKRLSLLRKNMEEAGVDAYLIPTEDFHNSEYVGDHFKCREYISGFTGSAGTLLVTMDRAWLWTDGRYFLQAEQQLSGSGIQLMRMGEPEVPQLMPFLIQLMKKGQTLGFDGRTLNARFAHLLARNFQSKKVKIRWDLDLVGDIWEERPALSCEPLWVLPLAQAGETAENKITWLREELRKQKTDILVLSTLDDIAWLLNLRGHDVSCNPVFLSYLILTQEEIRLYVQEQAITPEIQAVLENLGITSRPYDAVYQDLQQVPDGQMIWMDGNRANYSILKSIHNGVRVWDRPSPTVLRKAVKNPVEQENIRQAHIQDGVAVTKFMYWLKENVDKNYITEISAARHLEKLRQERPGYLEPSFDPILAYGPHGAIVHYSATSETDVQLEPHSFLLADTGGHYLQGTTDITRTIALGPVSDEQKACYTAVLRGNLNLGAAKFRQGCRGVNLDILAREPLWDLGMDFNHGTGHGVGYLLNVHEGPNAIRWKLSADRNQDPEFLPGMLTSNEPGVYLAGRYGIRLENLILCKKTEETDFGEFLEFETMTMVPFDLDAVDPEQMSQRQKRLLNAYHHQVRENIAPYLTPEERAWLYHATREI